jgi:AraC-like DNA-binding protein
MGFLNFLTSIICFFLFLFSINLFLAKRGSRTLNCLLTVIFFSRFGQMLVLLLVNLKQQSVVPFFHQLFTPLYFAAPACFYLYISHFIGQRKRLSKWEWLHFIPVVLAVVHVIPWPFSADINWSAIFEHIVENKQLFIAERSGLLPAYFYYIGRPMLVLGYLCAAWYVVLNSEVYKVKASKDPGKKWILIFLKAATFFQLIGFLPLISGKSDTSFANYLFVIIGCLVLLAIVVFVLYQPEIFYKYLFTPAEGNKVVEATTTTTPVKERLTKVSTSKGVNLLPDQSAEYADLMKSFMENKTPYLQPDFQIVDLANELDIPVHHCSFVINNMIGKNFRDWINEYRIRNFIIEYALLADKMTIEAIAYKSGFKSLATFYNAFKKETGLMPTTYFSQKKTS